MCLAIPGKVLSIEGEDPAFRSASVDFCGVRKVVSLAFTPEVQRGDFVLVHVGFALTRIDESEAHRTFEYLRRLGAIEEELGVAGDMGKGRTPGTTEDHGKAAATGARSSA
jgi:hydrogenase expression/formation protein HypC